MSRIVSPSAAAGHPVSLDIGRPVMAKAGVQILDIDWPRAIGLAVERAIAMCGWSKKEAAAKVGVDPAEFGKWLTGERRPQLDRLFAVQDLREPLVICLAGLASNVEVVTEIRFRRLA